MSKVPILKRGAIGVRQATLMATQPKPMERQVTDSLGTVQQLCRPA
jgi:hypothetical protein